MCVMNFALVFECCRALRVFGESEIRRIVKQKLIIGGNRGISKASRETFSCTLGKVPLYRGEGVGPTPQPGIS